jgi:hypothetical protein
MHTIEGVFVDGMRIRKFRFRLQPLQRDPSEACQLHRAESVPGSACARLPPDHDYTSSPLSYHPCPSPLHDPAPRNTPRTMHAPRPAQPHTSDAVGSSLTVPNSSSSGPVGCGEPTGNTRKEPYCSAASAVPYGRAYRDDMIKLTSAAILTHAEVNTHYQLTTPCAAEGLHSGSAGGRVPVRPPRGDDRIHHHLGGGAASGVEEWTVRLGAVSK